MAVRQMATEGGQRKHGKPSTGRNPIYKSLANHKNDSEINTTLSIKIISLMNLGLFRIGDISKATRTFVFNVRERSYLTSDGSASS